MTWVLATAMEEASEAMTPVLALTVFVLAMFVGLEIIGKIPTMLHTPLMSATNAIHGIVIVGAIVAAGLLWPMGPIVGTLALIAASINVFGGFLVTDRMLRMFKRRK